MNRDHFDFGQNWIDFSSRRLDAEAARAAESHFLELFAGVNLAGKSFLDVGFGQGLSLLIAAKNGALPVGCDVNGKCVEALDFSRRFFPETREAEIPVIVGSILDPACTKSILERRPIPSRNGFDIVHAWGSLHHTGDLYGALDKSMALVANGGLFMAAIYNRHWTSPAWRIIKKAYNRSWRPLQPGWILFFFATIALAKLLATRRNPFRRRRGMSFYYDIIDWLGGYPYEYASPGEVCAYVEARGFKTIKTIPPPLPTGCVEYIFLKKDLS